MSDADPQRRQIDDLGDQLEAMQATLGEILDEARRTNGRITDLENGYGKIAEDLYGPDEDRRRAADPGLMSNFSEVRRLVLNDAAAAKAARDFADAKRWIIGTSIALGTLLIGVLGFLVQIARTL